MGHLAPFFRSPLSTSLGFRQGQHAAGDSARSPAWSWALLLSLGLGACDNSETIVAPQAIPSVPPTVSVEPERERCVWGTAPAVYLGQRSGSDEGRRHAPHGVELGGVLAHRGGFVAAYLQTTSRGVEATLALMDPKLGVRQLSLGVVHGGVPPPKIAVNADGRVVIAMLDGDANGTLVRLATTDTGPSPAIVWGPLVPVGGDESDEIALVATSGRTLLVWDDWNRAENHGVVLGQVFSLPKLTARAERMSLSPNGVDAERPLLAGRDGGYWIVWLHHGVSKPSALGNALSQLAAPRANHNWLEITMLGEDGAPISSPRVLTPKRATISAFDLSVSTDGRALVASQQPSNGHGVTRGGRIELSLVAVGGNVDSTVLADDEVGVGLPSLTVSASNRQLQWLSFLDAEDRLRLGVVRFSSPPGSDVELVPGLAGQTVVAARQDELLFASQQGTRMALRLARCEHDVSEERGPRPVQARSVVPLPRPATSPLASAAIPADPASAAPPQPAPKPRATGLNSRGPKAAAPKTGEPSATGVKPALAEPPMPDFD